MKFKQLLFTILLVIGVIEKENIFAENISGYISLESRSFINDPAFQDQKKNNVSLSIQPEYRKKWNNEQNVFTFSPFYRKDLSDKTRTHTDIRQLDILIPMGSWEVQAGISKVFWGVTESSHLVDIINQTDAVENISGEDKLGQPLFKVGHLHDGGSVDLFILPYFREKTFPGEKGRLRTQFPVSTNNISYESSKKEKHIDYALRMQHTVDKLDVGLSYFNGTSRSPDLIPDLGKGVLKQHYPLIKQTGLDLQYTGEEWLWKLETIYRDSKKENYTALVGGFEYTKPRFAGTDIDLGLIAEYHYDSRGEVIEASFQNDLFLGARVSLNDMNSTEFLIGGYIDLDNQTQSFRVESSRRLAKDFKLNLEAQIFESINKRDPLYSFRKDGYIQLELQKFF